MPTLTGPTVLLTQSETSINALLNGSAYTVPTNAIRADVDLFVAIVTTTALLSPPNAITIQGCVNTDDKWVDLASFSTGTTTAANTTVSGASSAGATAIGTAGVSTFGGRTSLIYFRDSSSAGEWVRQVAHASSSIAVPSPGAVLAHANLINIYDQALRFYVSLDVSCIKRLRVTVDNNVAITGPTITVYAEVTAYAA